MERLKNMKETLMSCVQGQMTHLDSVDTEELGDVIDMIKDLEEAIYYGTITESMKKKEKEHSEEPKYYYPMPEYYRDMDREMGRRYYPSMYYGEEIRYANGGSSGGGSGSSSGGSSSGGGRGGSSGGSSNYANGNGSSGGSSSGSSGGSRNYTEREFPMEMMRDIREGRSPLSRKMYMESKEMHKDKAAQMKELDTYMQELSKDITEMIEGASPEEKQLLQQKISGLASKIH